MATTNPVTEQDLESALRIDIDYGLEFFDEFYRGHVFSFLKQEIWPKLTPDELKDAYQETLIAFNDVIRDVGFDPSAPLRMVYTIARNKGYDQLRRRNHRINTNVNDLLAVIGASLQGTEVGSRWNWLSASERKEFGVIVREAVCELPERQQIVARCFVDCFEDVINENSYRSLAEAVSQVTGKRETVVNVKSTWHVARKKIAVELARRGYTFIQGE